jgi:predicted short-subunit dehydrogenase-like oxidoreductase (DUF2520 family)
LAEPVSHVEDIVEDADLYLLCVSDTSIAEVAQKLKHINGIVAHTSGSVPMEVLNDNKDFGVFYPLQTFKDSEVNFDKIPILCEGNSGPTEAALMSLAFELSARVYSLNSEQRQKLHVAAVMANNFTNYLFAKAFEFCAENGIPFEILHPLILETARKATLGNPAEFQTGPANRNDESTITRHLELIADPKLRALYASISKNIQDH